MDLSYWRKILYTVEPHSMVTHLMWTPVYNRQFRLSRQKAHNYILSQINPLKKDNIFLYPESDSHIIVNPVYGH